MSEKAPTPKVHINTYRTDPLTLGSAWYQDIIFYLVILLNQGTVFELMPTLHHSIA